MAYVIPITHCDSNTMGAPLVTLRSIMARPPTCPALPCSATASAASCKRRYAKHAGTKLVPPLGGLERMEAFPPLQPTDVVVQGASWQESSRDIAIAGGLAGGCGSRLSGGPVGGPRRAQWGGLTPLAWRCLSVC